MFKKILIANRGEIAVRIIRACREMGILAVALYEAPDMASLHVRLADECVLLDTPAGFMDQANVLRIARECGAEAIHPGYGFLAEQADFIHACEAAGIAFIGPPAGVVQNVRHKINAQQKARAAGFPTLTHSEHSFGDDEWEALQAAAEEMGYPLVVKSCSGGRGPGERLIRSADSLVETVRRARAQSKTVFDEQRLYLEKAIIPAHQVGVQILADKYGHLIHLGDREGSVQYSNQKVLEETPAPCLNETQREELWQTAVALARLFGYQNAGTVEFLVDEAGQFYFSEFKARIQVEHPLTEAITGVDLVQAQIRLAAGEPLRMTQADVKLDGWAMLCRVRAEDPWRRFMASPGRVLMVRLPGGMGIRTDTYIYCNCDIPEAYDPLIAKLTVWGPDRNTCTWRLRCALEDFKLVGPATNVPLLQQIVRSPEFVAGRYSTSFLVHPFTQEPVSNTYLRDMAVIAAILYQRRSQLFMPSVPERTNSNWHRGSRRLPQ